MPYAGIKPGSSTEKKVERCVKELMADPDFKPKAGRDKKSSAVAVCRASIEGKKIEKGGKMPNININFYGDNQGYVRDEVEEVAENVEKKKLTTATRKKIPSGKFAYIDSKGGKHLPIHDACLHGNTSIPTLDGKKYKISELVGKEVWVYGYDTVSKSIVPAKAKNIRKTLTNVELIKVTLDNGKFVLCTPDHKFLLRNGTYQEAGYLKKEQSIMPLYKEKKKHKMKGERMAHYEWVYQPFYNFWELTHHMVYRGFTGEHLEKGHVVHHKDNNHHNNIPSNLNQLSREKHCSVHMKLNLNDPKKAKFWKKVRSKASKKRWAKLGEREKQAKLMRRLNAERGIENNVRAMLKKRWDRDMTEFARNDVFVEQVYKRYMDGEKVRDLAQEYAVSRGTIQNHFSRLNLPMNHKVTSIESAGIADVYDMEVPETNNFAIDTGIFVHNSHVRNAMARFNQTHFESSEKKKSAARKILAAARRMGIEIDPKSGIASATKKVAEGKEVTEKMAKKEVKKVKKAAEEKVEKSEKVKKAAKKTAEKKTEVAEPEDAAKLQDLLKATIEKVDSLLAKQEEEEKKEEEKPEEKEKEEEKKEESAPAEGAASPEEKKPEEEAPEGGESKAPEEEAEKVEKDASSGGAEVAESLNKVSDSLGKLEDRFAKVEERLTKLEKQPAPSKVVSPVAVSKGEIGGEVSEADTERLKEINEELKKLEHIKDTNLDRYQLEKMGDKAFDLVWEKEEILRRSLQSAQ